MVRNSTIGITLLGLVAPAWAVVSAPKNVNDMGNMFASLYPCGPVQKPGGKPWDKIAKDGYEKSYLTYGIASSFLFQAFQAEGKWAEKAEYQSELSTEKKFAEMEPIVKQFFEENPDLSPQVGFF